MFCADIRGHSWQSAHTHARGNIHHGTAALLFHVGDNALRQLDYCLHIYLVAHFPSVRVGLHDRSVERRCPKVLWIPARSIRPTFLSRIRLNR